MKNKILLLLIPLFVAVPVGMLGCELWMCAGTIPPLLFISFTFILYVVIKFFENKSRSLFLKLLSLLGIPLYLLLILFIIGFFMQVVGDWRNYNFRTTFNKDSLGKGSLTEQETTYVYTNNSGGYQLRIPKDWGFQTSRDDTVFLNPSGSENYKENTEISISYYSTPPNLTIGLQPNEIQISFKGQKAAMSHPGIIKGNVAAVTFERNNITYHISIHSRNASLVSNYLKIIEDSFTFTK